MRRSISALACVTAGVAACSILTPPPLAAQSIPGAVLARNEPHHHPAYEDGTLRVLRVLVPPHDTTLLHEHDPDYFWIALGASEVVNVKLGSSAAIIKSADLSIHYTLGKFAHVARNPGDAPFRNITVELLGKQVNPRNLCEEAVGGAPLACPTAGRGAQSGVTARPAFETDQLRVSLVTVEPGRSLRGTGGGEWFIALELADAPRLPIGVPANPDGKGPVAEWRGGVWRSPRTGEWSIRNDAPGPLRLLEVAARTR